MDATWTTAKAGLKKSAPAQIYRLWIDPLKASRRGGYLVLECHNHFFRKKVQARCLGLIQDELNRLAESDPSIGRLKCILEVKPASSAKNPRPNLQRELPCMTRRSAGQQLRKGMTFDSFIVGDSNELAFQASMALASCQSNRIPALFLLSRPGLGKTHLSMAVGHHILTAYPNERVRYISADDFSNEMVRAFRTNTLDAFKSKFRSQCDVLMIENVNLLTGKERTQVELALALDSLMNAGKKLIFTSCYLPKDIHRLSPDLRSRLACGLISEIDSPDYKTRVRILKAKAGTAVPDEIIRYLAADLTEDIRQLEGAVYGLTSRASLMGTPIDLNLAQTVVKDIADKRKAITPNTIKKLVCKTYNITEADITSKNRRHAILLPRQIAMYLTRKYTTIPLKDIGRHYNRYHATVIHSINAVERDLSTGTLKAQIDYLCRKLGVEERKASEV